ncbi:MAG TPA: peptidoglycan-binding domain-containing protein [Candidatus Paceibacterota bacterium]
MMHSIRALCGTFVLALVCVPFVSEALSQDEIRVQIQALLAELNAAKQQLTNLTVPTIPAPVVSATKGYCPDLSRSLSRGSRGSDVNGLQLFLTSAGYLDNSAVTGFFGPITESAVKKWQSAYGIVSSGSASETGYGVVGFRTRSLIGLNCNLTPGVSGGVLPVQEQTCPTAPPPLTYCSTGWQAITDNLGCTRSYKCSVPLAQVGSCTPYETPACSGGNLVSLGVDASGCSKGYRCDTSASMCAKEATAAQEDSYGKICTQNILGLRCPHDTSYTFSATNGCLISYLQSRNWTDATNTGTLPLTVSVSPQSVLRQQNLVISWNAYNAPAGSKVRLEAYPSGTTPYEWNNDNGLTADTSQLPTSGSYTWIVPAFERAIMADAGFGGFSMPAGQYVIVAKLYSGDTCWGFCAGGIGRTIHAKVTTSPFTVQ